MKKSRLLGAVCVSICAIITTLPVSASIFELSFTGQYTLVDNSGIVMDQQPISSIFTYDSDLGTGSSAATLSISDFDTFGNTADIYGISMELVTVSGTNYVVGNMLADWGGSIGVPISTVWDATGLINAITFGLEPGDVISGSQLKRGGSDIFDVGSATPASDGLSIDGLLFDPNPTLAGDVLTQGPAPLAVTTLNTSTLCTPDSFFNSGDGNCMGNALSGGFPFTEDWIAGSPMVDGPFPGLNVNFDIGSGNSVTVLTVDGVGVVPIPGAVWLFGSGLLGLVGMARQKKTA